MSLSLNEFRGEVKYITDGNVFVTYLPLPVDLGKYPFEFKIQQHNIKALIQSNIYEVFLFRWFGQPRERFVLMDSSLLKRSYYS